MQWGFPPIMSMLPAKFHENLKIHNFSSYPEIDKTENITSHNMKLWSQRMWPHHDKKRNNTVLKIERYLSAAKYTAVLCSKHSQIKQLATFISIDKAENHRNFCLERPLCLTQTQTRVQASVRYLLRTAEYEQLLKARLGFSSHYEPSFGSDQLLSNTKTTLSEITHRSRSPPPLSDATL